MGEVGVKGPGLAAPPGGGGANEGELSTIPGGLFVKIWNGNILRRENLVPILKNRWKFGAEFPGDDTKKRRKRSYVGAWGHATPWQILAHFFVPNSVRFQNFGLSKSFPSPILENAVE